jgi:Fur family iron response transcriptional regulator
MKSSCLSPAEIEDVLRRAGIQPTAQRIAIGRYVLCEADHPTAEQVKHWVDQNFPKISLATIYNTLNAFVQAGLLHEVRLPDREAVLFDNNLDHHHHFLDLATGEILDLPPESVKVDIALGAGYDVSRASVVVQGTRSNPR